MRVPTHILVAISDPHCASSPAVDRAATIAEKTGATLTIFHSLYSPYVAGEQFYKPIELQHDIEHIVNIKKRALERLSQPLRARGINAHVRCRWDYPVFESIVREVVREKIDLLLIDGHRHNRALRLVLSNTDWQLLRLCPCPLLIVKSALPYRSPAIVASIDPLHSHAKPADLDVRLLDAGVFFEQLFNGQLHAAHCYVEALPIAISLPINGLSLASAVRGGDVEHIRDAFLAEIKPYQLTDAQQHLRVGDVVQSLPELVKELGAQLVVMGAVSRSALKRLFIGHSAEQVIDQLNCDVLIVKPDDFVTTVPASATIRPVMFPSL